MATFAEPCPTYERRLFNLDFSVFKNFTVA